jgi:hypothetical protein
MRGGWCSKEVGGSYGVGMWKCIQRGWDIFKQRVRFEVGNGSCFVYYSMCKGGMGVGEYGYNKWCYSLERNVHLTCS